MYLYKTVIYHDTNNVVTLPADNATDVTDFEDPTGDNKKGNSVAITELDIAETTFSTDDTYSTFDGRVDGTTIEWTDVKYIDDGKAYCLYLASDTEL